MYRTPHIPGQLGGQRVFPNAHDSDIGDFGMTEKNAFQLGGCHLELEDQEKRT